LGLQKQLAQVVILAMPEMDDRRLMMADIILVVDENPGIQRSLKRFLTQSGYLVITADSAQNAIQIVDQTLPSLVILDVKMPINDGIELISAIKKSDHSLPIIIMTAYPTSFTRKRLLKYGIDAYVTKPFDPEEILRYIHQLLSVREKIIEHC
jgi:two-component system, response regulator, stage 0 sporulation protein F